MKNRISLYAVCFAGLFVFATGFFYYPKWKQQRTEATISWDVSGYYFYLPAIFIYKDLKQLQFKDEILPKYGPTPNLQQAYLHESGNYILKYSCGQAVQYLPFFAAAHLIALNSTHEADGFSPPYQLLISIGSWLIAFLGLWYLRKILLVYFADRIVAVTILLLVLGSNYLDYSAINGAMTHNNLFTIYSLLLWLSHRFYQSPTYGKAFAIGCLIGLAALTRPTEIISALIPLFWGLSSLRLNALGERLAFYRKHFPKLLLAILATAAIGSLQLIYWKYVSGDWFVYSYEDQGFSWLKPHFYHGILSARSGWLVYSPIMVFSLLGFIFLYRKAPTTFWASLFFSSLFIYITFAWDIWWYGGSLGIRAMVQSYPILAFPMAAFVGWVFTQKRALRLGFGAICVLFVYYNLWLTHQAHRGGLLRPGEMTKAYFWGILGRYDVPLETQKLLDNRYDFIGYPQNAQVVYQNNFEADTTTAQCELPPITGQGSLCLNKTTQNSPWYSFELNPGNAEWFRATATFRCKTKEWNIWRSTVFQVRLFDGEEEISSNYLRVYRLLYDGDTRRISLDVKLRQRTPTRGVVEFWNGDSDKPILIDDFVVEVFEE
ncbi:MAG: hypothetical protein AAF798_08985 [Bacteroidota bacterium]